MKYQKMSAISHKSAPVFASTAIKNGSPPVNVIDEDVCLPAAVIKQEALENNLHWMQKYADAAGVVLLPHGKTTMAPSLFQQQIAHGAWGIGVGTPWQARVAVEAGVKKIVMANQLVGKANMALIAGLKQAHPEVTIYCCVDGVSNAQALSDFFSQQQLRMDVLLELGVAGKRCGCRTMTQAQALAQALAKLPGLRFAGVELYEGVIHGGDATTQIEAFVRQAVDFVHWLEQQKLLDKGETLFTGAGTAWFDIVASLFSQAILPANMLKAIRPGCYITHDKGVYDKAQRALMQRDPLARKIGGDLRNALELVAYIQSVPEPGMAVINFGKRDTSFDEGLPQPVAHFRHGKALATDLNEVTTFNIMDQHAMITFPADRDLQTGDVMAFAISHPCLTFDKWKQIYLVDEQYHIVEVMETCF